MLRKKRTRRRSRWLPKQPRLGARMCPGTFFFICFAYQGRASDASADSSAFLFF